MTAIALFAASYTVVLALGLQSLNVNRGHRLLAFVNSLVIGASNLVLLKYVPGPTSAYDVAGYLLGGPFGIVTSMWLHPHITRLEQRLRGRRAPPAVATEKPAP